MTDEPLYTAKQVAEMCQLPVRRVHAACRFNELEYIDFGSPEANGGKPVRFTKKKRFTKPMIDRWIAKMTNSESQGKI